MQLRQAKTLGVLYHHQRRIGHIHTDFDHCRADQHAHLSAHKQGHHGFLFDHGHARVQQAHHHPRQGGAQCLMRFSGIGQVQHFTLFNQRADPIDLSALRQLGADALNDLVAPRIVDQFGHDGRASGWKLVKGGHLQVGVITHGQGARDGCRRHHE